MSDQTSTVPAGGGFRLSRGVRVVAATAAIALVAVGCANKGSSGSSSSGSGGQVTVGLITKTETNPFFVKMKDGAQKEADAKGMKLMTAAGRFDGDNAAQVTAIENLEQAAAFSAFQRPEHGT